MPYYRLNGNPVSFDSEGNLTDLVTNLKGTMMLPNFTVRGISPETRAKNYSSSFNRHALPDLINWGMENTIGKAILPIVEKYPVSANILKAMTPSSYIGTLREGKAPWDLTNTGFGGSKDMQSANLLFDLAIGPKVLKGTNRGINSAHTFIKRLVTPHRFKTLELPNKPLPTLNLPLLPPKRSQLSAINILPSSGKPILLTRFTTSQMEAMIDKINKWGTRYKYSKIPKSAAKNPRIAEELILDRLTEHNTFVRGIRDDPSHREAANLLALKLFGIDKPDVFDRLKAMAISYAPKTGHGRAGFSALYNGLGSLYASNSLSTGKAYSDAIRSYEGMGAIAVVKRPIDFNAPLDTWLILADIPFMNELSSVRYYLHNLPFLNLTGKSLNTEAAKLKKGIAPLKTKADIILLLSYTELSQQLKWLGKVLEYNKKFPGRFKYASVYFNPRNVNSLVNNAQAQRLMNRMEDLLLERFISKYAGKSLEELDKLVTSEMPNINDIPSWADNKEVIDIFNTAAGLVFNRHNKEAIRKTILNTIDKEYNKSNLLGRIPTTVEYNKVMELHNVSPLPTPKGNGLITSEKLRRSTRGSQDAYLHFIFVGPENTLALEFVKFLNPEGNLPIPSDTHISRLHRGISSAGLSRKSLARGGILVNNKDPLAF